MARGRNKARKATRAGKPTHSIYPGVTFEKKPERRLRRWKATISKARRQINLGRFATEAEAAQAYRDALLIYPL